jgi:hypothetical protein
LLVGQKITEVHQTALAIKGISNAIKDELDIGKVETWLRAPDSSTNINRAKAQRHAGTGTWLLDSPIFQSWRAGSCRHLWLHGFAGCGKTVLSSTILDYLATADDILVLRFFFDFSNSSKQTMEGCTRSLAWQLYQQRPSAAAKLNSSLLAHGNGKDQPNEQALLDLVCEMLTSCGRVAIVLDALDESTTRNELLGWIQRIATNTEFVDVQLLLTARPESIFLQKITLIIGSQSCLELNEQSVDADIISYVTAELKQPRFKDMCLPQDLLKDIRSKVGEGAHGM